MGIVHTLTGHAKDLGGGFTVRRLLPAAQQRSVGPFVFFDHFGPVTETPADNHDVRPHPHIGLATVTYLFEGAQMHRDSLGTVQRITPGAINWMSAGRGIVHSERKPDDLRDSSYGVHGLQLWVALPREQEEGEPFFQHTAADAIPQRDLHDAKVRLLVGEALGEKSPVSAQSPTLYLDVALPPGGTVDLPPMAAEMAVYPVTGEVLLDGQPLEPNRMAVLQPGAVARVTSAGGARFAVVGGEPLDGPRHMWWNFVSTRKERIVQAADDWAARRMGKVDGDPELIPLPPTRFTL